MLKSQIEISKLRPGMYILFKGRVTLVTASDLSVDSFGYTSFKGDSTKTVVTQIQFEIPRGRAYVLG